MKKKLCEVPKEVNEAVEFINNVKEVLKVLVKLAIGVSIAFGIIYSYKAIYNEGYNDSTSDNSIKLNHLKYEAKNCYYSSDDWNAKEIEILAEDNSSHIRTLLSYRKIRDCLLNL